MLLSLQTLFAAFLCLSAVSADFDSLVYKAIGDQVVLSPHSVPDLVSNITWRRGDEVLVELYGGDVHVHPQFKGRVQLSNSTGDLTITQLTREDAGSFAAEINERRASIVTRLHVISPLSKPSISVRCHPDADFCLFTCEGNTLDAGPVTFGWVRFDMTEQGTNMLRATEGMELWFRCFLENPVSYNISDIVYNPLAQARRRKSLALLITFFTEISLVILLSCLLCCFCKCKKGEKVEASEQEKSQIPPQGQKAETVNEKSPKTISEGDHISQEEMNILL